jgi:hypothetical protein
MDNVIRLTAEKKKKLFREFLLARNPSEKFARTYFIYLHSTVVRRACAENTSTDDIFSVENIDIIENIYDKVKLDDKNIANHNVYSGAVSAYRKFLMGKPLRTRVGEKRHD